MKTLILLHGALGAAVDLAMLEQDLKKQLPETYSFSFSGHGKSSFTPAFGIAEFANELEAFIQEKELKNVIIFGYSMGGYVALYLAAQKPQLIQKIMTLGTKFNWSAETVEKETRMLNPGLMLEKIPGFAKSLEQKHGEAWKELVQRTAELMREIHQKQFLSPEIINGIKIPVCLGLADKDQMVSLDETVTTFRHLPNASMYMLPGSRHPIDTVPVELLSHLVLDFANKA